MNYFLWIYLTNIFWKLYPSLEDSLIITNLSWASENVLKVPLTEITVNVSLEWKKIFPHEFYLIFCNIFVLFSMISIIIIVPSLKMLTNLLSETFKQISKTDIGNEK